jgi:hypothetical protein
VIVLDENLNVEQVALLRSWRIKFRRIGRDLGYLGIKDPDLIPLLHRHAPLTFFTLDQDFFDHDLCHAGYCLVFLDVDENDAASFIRRFLRHPAFKTQAKRLGNVVRVDQTKLRVWRLHAEDVVDLVW